MRNVTKKLGLKDKGKYLNHRCACGADLRKGEYGQRNLMAYCPSEKKIINTITVPRFPASAFIKTGPHTD